MEDEQIIKNLKLNDGVDAGQDVVSQSISAGGSALNEQSKAQPEQGTKQGDEQQVQGQDMSFEDRYEVIRSVGAECVTEEDLKRLIQKKPNPVCYDGFEPSGRMHIAQGVKKALIVNKLTSAGCTFKFWIADWFAQLNNKMGGDLKKIKIVGSYMIEIWKALGMDMSRVEFLYASELINQRPDEYWSLVMDIAMKNNLPRIKRCCTIMGRNEDDDLSAAQIFYPCMQCADIFFLKVDICQLGIDQRKVNMLAREYCDSIKRKNKPIILSHSMLPGLIEGQAKMSKSDPSSAIFMEDTAAEVNVKIKKAFCPPGVVQDNPCIEYVKDIVLPWLQQQKPPQDFLVSRKEQFGGDKSYSQIEDIKEDYLSEKLHPGDLKLALSKYLNIIIEPVRKHFTENTEAKKLLNQVKAYKTTR